MKTAKHHSKICTRWLISFGILALYTSLLMTADSRVRTAEAATILNQTYSTTWERRVICAFTRRGEDCSRFWVIFIPVVTHIS